MQRPTLDGVPVSALRERCRVPELRVLDSTTSTNDDLRALAEDGAPAWTTIVAEFQEAGRGRGGQPWQAGPGESLLFSTLVRYTGAAPALTAAPVRAGLRMAKALEQSAGVRALVKWPNDLYVGPRKLAGILCEGVVNPRGGYIVVGIGINVAQQRWPDDLANAVSLFEATGRVVSRAELLTAILPELREGPDLHAALEPYELDQLRERDYLRDRSIAVDDSPAGIADGITPHGELRVIAPDRRRRLIRTGSVRLAG